jgi:hypothetical protein
MAVKELSDKGPDGTRLGQSTSDLIAFHGSSPTDQYTLVAAVGTSTPIQASAYGFTATQAAAILALVNDLRALVVEKGLGA